MSAASMRVKVSRLWENVVGRSRGFWEHFYPLLQRIFARVVKRFTYRVPSCYQ